MSTLGTGERSLVFVLSNYVFSANFVSLHCTGWGWSSSSSLIRIESYQPCDARSIGGGGRGRRAPQVGELHDGEQGELA